MSGIYIKGMEMPKGDNNIVLFLYPDGKVVACGVLGPRGHYEAIHVPDHGRLIDADAFISFIRENWDSYDQWFAEMLEARPTIIPAEEGAG